MRLVKHLSENSIMLEVEADDKLDLIKKMSERMSGEQEVSAKNITFDRILDSMLIREKQSSTGIGSGYAFPHARIPEIRNLSVVIAVLKNELDYGSIDGKPVKVACMVLAPEKNPTLSLKVMSLVAKLFSDEKAKETISNARDAASVLKVIKESGLDLDVPIMARDIMRDQLFNVNPDTPLKDVTALMSANHVNAIPVTNEGGLVVGEISCSRLFQLGIPDFFKQLKSVAFISEFDPFEKYFFVESKSCARDVMSEDFCSMPPTATLLEIVFALTVLRHPNVYVVDDAGGIAGIIDQSTVLDQVLNI